MVIERDSAIDETTAGEEVRPFESGIDWRAGGAAGFLATLVTGLVIVATDVTTLQQAVAGLYGFEGSLVMGWIAHLVHGTIFGIIFATVLADPGLHRLSEWAWKTVLAGAVYGLVLAVIAAGIIMPIWLGLVGVETELAIPAVTVPSVGWHLLYGVVLGIGYFAVKQR